MSIHVRRAEPNRASAYILVIGLLCAFGAFMYETYKKPRLIFVEAVPEYAKLYIDNNVVCANLPCEITLKNWPKDVRIVADRHYSEQITVSLFEHFKSNRHSFKVSLKAFPERSSKPKIVAREKDLKLSPQLDVPKRTPSPPTPVSKPPLELPLTCRETQEERQRILNRPPILCYSEDDKSVTFNKPGECYAAYWVSIKGHVQKLQGFGCMHEELTEPARRAFKNRIYLPGLKNGKPVEKAVETDIKYGSKATSSIREESDLSANETLNRDAQILFCPPVATPKSMTRSGHCIFEFDLSKQGRISQIRQTSCTHDELMIVISSAFQQCDFVAAKTDGVKVARPYMKHQIDVDVFDSQGRKIPVHASFGEKSVNKPYIIYE